MSPEARGLIAAVIVDSLSCQQGILMYFLAGVGDCAPALKGIFPPGVLCPGSIRSSMDGVFMLT